jgi:hypothetical protein
VGLLPLVVCNHLSGPSYLAVEVFGDRWSLPALRDTAVGDRLAPLEHTF